MSGFLPSKIVHVAVRQPLPDLDAEPEWEGLLLVFWCDEIPVGDLFVPRSLLPLTSSQLMTMVSTAIAPAVGNRLVRTAFARDVLSPKDAPSSPPDLARLLELERPLEACAQRLRTATEPVDAGGPSVSVVICTKNRPEALRLCLASIRALSPPPTEVIVVDTDPRSGLTATVTAAFPEVRYVAESTNGLSAARNIGIREARGDVIAFTDDDVSVHPRWIGVLRRAFDDPTVAAATGLVLPAELATPAQSVCHRECRRDFRVSEFGSAFFRSWIDRGVPTWRLGAAANMAFRRDAFERVGGFDERLGVGAAGSSEDSELWYRLLAEGYSCRYEPAAVVFSYRTDWNELSARTFSHTRGFVAALFFQFDRYKHWGNLDRACRRLPRRFLALAFNAFKGAVLTEGSGKSPVVRPLWPQIRGAVAGYGYYLRHRRLGRP